MFTGFHSFSGFNDFESIHTVSDWRFTTKFKGGLAWNETWCQEGKALSYGFAWCHNDPSLGGFFHALPEPEELILGKTGHAECSGVPDRHLTFAPCLWTWERKAICASLCAISDRHFRSPDIHSAWTYNHSTPPHVCLETDCEGRQETEICDSKDHTNNWYPTVSTHICKLFTSLRKLAFNEVSWISHNFKWDRNIRTYPCSG